MTSSLCIPWWVVVLVVFMVLYIPMAILTARLIRWVSPMDDKMECLEMGAVWFVTLPIALIYVPRRLMGRYYDKIVPIVFPGDDHD